MREGQWFSGETHTHKKRIKERVTVGSFTEMNAACKVKLDFWTLRAVV